MEKLLEKNERKNLLEEYDYEEKVRVLNLSKRIGWFIDNKGEMSQNEKWEAFDDICEDYDGHSRDRLMQMINNEIRRRGLSI